MELKYKFDMFKHLLLATLAITILSSIFNQFYNFIEAYIGYHGIDLIAGIRFIIAGLSSLGVAALLTILMTRLEKQIVDMMDTLKYYYTKNYRLYTQNLIILMINKKTTLLSLILLKTGIDKIEELYYEAVMDYVSKTENSGIDKYIISRIDDYQIYCFKNGKELSKHNRVGKIKRKHPEKLVV